MNLGMSETEAPICPLCESREFVVELPSFIDAGGLVRMWVCGRCQGGNMDLIGALVKATLALNKGVEES